MEETVKSEDGRRRKRGKEVKLERGREKAGCTERKMVRRIEVYGRWKKDALERKEWKEI